VWGERRGSYRVFMEQVVGKRPLWKCKHRWEDNIKVYIKDICSVSRLFSCCSGYGPEADSCEWGDEPSFFRKSEEFVG
jgi:hypothetical protein